MSDAFGCLVALALLLLAALAGVAAGCFTIFLILL